LERILFYGELGEPGAAGTNNNFDTGGSVMTVDTAAEQKLFRDTTAEFVASETPLATVRALNASGESFSREWWQRATEIGWATLLVPEELGGGSVSGEGVRDLVDVATELGRSVGPGPLHPVNVVLAGLVDATDGPDHGELIDALVSGASIASWAVYEPGSQWNPAAPGLTASASGAGFVLSGVKDRVESALQADVFLVTASTENGPLQFVVSTSAPGVAVEASGSLDAVKQYGTVTFDNVEVSADAVVGSPASTAALIERQSQIANLLQVAETVGALDTVFNFTVQWAFDRYSFGRPLASYQALKHRFADMKLWIEASRATLDGATQAVQDRADNAPYLVSVAKSYVGQRSVEIVQDAVQLHGGIGVTWEHDLHLFLRRVTVNRQLFGTPGEHRRLIASQLGL
jgi:alkylation response protein AidB-like acyl-CoA dehydrogenase